MKNKQPFYCELNLLFTTTRTPSNAEIDEVVGALQSALARRLELVGKVEVESFESEPGDPADLM